MPEKLGGARFFMPLVGALLPNNLIAVFKA